MVAESNKHFIGARLFVELNDRLQWRAAVARFCFGVGLAFSCQPADSVLLLFPVARFSFRSGSFGLDFDVASCVL